MVSLRGTGTRVQTRRRAIAAAAAILVAAAAVILWARDEGTPRGSVDATIVLTGGSCRSHAKACAKLAEDGSVVIFGPAREGTAEWPRHLVRMHGPVTKLSLHLKPGSYSLAFFIQPPLGTLLPDFGKSPGEGGFTVRQGPVHLGNVRPSTGWILVGD